MLRVYFGDREDSIYPAGRYFDAWVDEQVVTDDFAKKVIKGVDKTDVMPDGTLKSPVFGGIVPRQLSGGTKSILVIYTHPELVVDLASMGDNCFPYLIELAKSQDITVTTDKFRYLFDYGLAEVFIVNDGSVVHNEEEFLIKYYDLKDGSV